VDNLTKNRFALIMVEFSDIALNLFHPQGRQTAGRATLRGGELPANFFGTWRTCEKPTCYAHASPPTSLLP